MDPRLGVLEHGSEEELYRVLRHLELNPAELDNELLRAVTRFALERLGWLHAFFAGRPLDASSFPPGGEVNWMDVRGWVLMALNVLSSVEPGLGRFRLNMPDPLHEIGAGFPHMPAAGEDGRAFGALLVVEEAIDRLAAATDSTISQNAKQLQAGLKEDR